MESTRVREGCCPRRGGEGCWEEGMVNMERPSELKTGKYLLDIGTRALFNDL